MYLEKIDSPKDLKKLEIEKLPVLADELRKFLIDNVSKTGGHLASSLGVVELTIALHYCFDSPKDKIIWDVGHQAYPHKILTGRRDRFHTLRQHGGISGFPKIDESEHDIFGVGHASTSISAALGIAKARDIKKEKFDVVSVIGDGAMTGGIALEAINQAGYLGSPFILILNDNRMSIAANVGALSEYTHRIAKTKVYKDVKQDIDTIINKASGDMKGITEKLKAHLKEVGAPGLLFEKLGFNYIWPVDGHDINKLLESLENAKQIEGPVLLHIITKKGKGYEFSENDATKFHGLSAFNAENGKALKKKTDKSYTEVFADTLVRLADENENIVGITAAMPHGTGLIKFAEKYPDRFYDVGIAEQHAVTFAAGLAVSGLKPVVAVYSTFLQRAYDQIVHDVCLQNLPIVFALDRAGLVGEDGPTHHGVLDLTYLRSIPNMIVMAPKDENELQHMLKTAIDYNGPIAIRYPRGSGFGIPLDNKLQNIEIGKSETIKNGSDLVIVAVGSMVYESLEAARLLEKQNIDAAVVNARFVKPVDKEILKIINDTGGAVIVEENAVKGGFGSAVLEELHKEKIDAQVTQIGIPDKFIEHGSQKILREKYGLTRDNIVLKSKELLE
ncbi:MAG: 1-deoxy-D-xylulose-5-phosphate synthase [Candidatus Woesearchaeota archaeon]|jgi:1-deoxy-D-xylulose-5-phosphate synthase|nr:1-deoxy-D-xylulose-5-phosphate synthase [Candidatus Woesearchaeota archaeon]